MYWPTSRAVLGRVLYEVQDYLFQTQFIAFDNQVGQEDLGLVEGVQRGVASGALEHGVLMSHSEQLIAHFQALTAAALAL